MGWGGDKYIYPCICITAYSCWAVCSLGPTVLEAEGSTLIGKGSLSAHSEAKVSGATAAPPPRSPHQLCRAECARFSVPPLPPAPASPWGCESCSSCPGAESGSELRPQPPPGPRAQGCPGAEGLLCLGFPVLQASSLCPRRCPGPPRHGPSVIPAWCWPHRCQL